MQIWFCRHIQNTNLSTAWQTCTRATSRASTRVATAESSRGSTPSWNPTVPFVPLTTRPTRCTASTPWFPRRHLCTTTTTNPTITTTNQPPWYRPSSRSWYRWPRRPSWKWYRHLSSTTCTSTFTPLRLPVWVRNHCEKERKSTVCVKVEEFWFLS